METRDLILRYGFVAGKRYTRRQKLKFLLGFTQDLEELGWRTEAKETTEKNLKNVNLYIGDLGKARVIAEAYYDTPPVSLTPGAYRFFSVSCRRNERMYAVIVPMLLILAAGADDIVINFIILPEFFDVASEMIGKNNVLADFLADSLKEKNGISRYLYFQVSENLQIQNLMENLIDSLLHKQGNEEQINRHTMGLLFLHLMNAVRFLKESTPNQYRNLLMMTTLRYIEENYRTGSLTQLCDMLNQSISGLSRMIRKSTGYTYKELLQRRRFRKAVELLVETELPVNDIVTAVGYENNSYFYRKFRERYQMTPNAYRERYRGSDRVRV